MKFLPKFRISPDPEIPWFVQCKFAFNKSFVDSLKKFPGAQYLHRAQVWLVPIEILDLVVQLALEHGFNVLREGSPPKAPKAALPSLRNG